MSDPTATESALRAELATAQTQVLELAAQVDSLKNQPLAPTPASVIPCACHQDVMRIIMQTTPGNEAQTLQQVRAWAIGS